MLISADGSWKLIWYGSSWQVQRVEMETSAFAVLAAADLLTVGDIDGKISYIPPAFKSPNNY